MIILFSGKQIKEEDCTGTANPYRCFARNECQVTAGMCYLSSTQIAFIVSS